MDTFRRATLPWRTPAVNTTGESEQTFSDEAFLARAVSLFVGIGLADGEGAVIIATPDHALNGLSSGIADAVLERTRYHYGV